MTRVVHLSDSQGAARFELLYTALHHAGDKTVKRQRDTIYKEARILEALESISSPASSEAPVLCANCGCVLNASHIGMPATRDKRTLNPGNQTLSLSEEDYALLDHYLQTTPWLPSTARAVVDALTWFESAETLP